MSDPSKFHLRVTAGPSYDKSSHKLIPVNTSTPTTITSSHLAASLTINIQNYRGIPTSSPSTSSYFSHPLHKHDLYSISFSFTPHEDINGADLLFGNDFELPIRDHLPPGFSAALRVAKWTIDPGLDGDVYADHPYLYGPLLSSINVLRVGEKGKKQPSGSAEDDDIITEGADGDDAEDIREDAGVPEDGPKRMKHFLNVEHRKAWTFESGREYKCDFFNPYLDFNDLALKIPGMTMHLMRFWDGQPLRYTLKKKNAEVDQELMVIEFMLVPEEDLEEGEKKWTGQQSQSQTGDAQEQHQVKKDAPKGQSFQDDDVD